MRILTSLKSILVKTANPKLKGAALSRPFERLVRREIEQNESIRI